MPRVPLIRLAELEPPCLKRIVIADHEPVLLVATQGRYHVLDDTCGHGAASLADGELVGDEILCAHHRGGFDIRSGAATRPPCAQAQRCHEVFVEAGVLYMDIGSGAIEPHD